MGNEFTLGCLAMQRCSGSSIAGVFETHCLLTMLGLLDAKDFCWL